MDKRLKLHIYKYAIKTNLEPKNIVLWLQWQIEDNAIYIYIQYELIININNN